MDTVVVPARLDTLCHLRSHVQQSAQRAGLTARQTYGLCQAVDEIATNIVTHGRYPADTTPELTLHTRCTDADLIVTLEDTTLGYDPRLTPLPMPAIDPNTLEPREPGGFGVFLALRAVDHFYFEQIDERNRNVFVIHRPNPRPNAI